jgi:hypothetical protein
MRQLITAFQKILQSIPLGRLLTVLFASALLFFTTACNNGNEVGARPNNPPVQAGGQNNPYKGGGDGYTQYKTAPADPTARNASDQASSKAVPGARIANHPNGMDGLQYPGEEKAKSSESVNDFVSPERQRALQDPGQFPAQPQPVFDRSDPDAKLLEKVGQTFKDASEFVREGLESSTDTQAAR